MMPPSHVIALVNAQLIDPERGTIAPGAVLVRDGVIDDFGSSVDTNGATVVDCEGDCLAPGLIDMRVFAGEPGAEHRESIATASQAAAAGGVTTFLTRPDTDPVSDNPAVIDYIARRARDMGRVRILPTGALTKGLKGEEIAEIGLMQAAGAVAFGDGPFSVQNAQTMRRAMAYARDFDALVMNAPVDASLSDGSVVHESLHASWLGLPGEPAEAETIALERDISLAALTGARYHASLISCAASVEIVARAKARGLAVTCGVSINHLTLNEIDIGPYRTFLKLRPPLRSEDDRLALVEAVADGTIDVIVSDHDPQDVETKRLPFAESAPGAIGIETLLSAALRLHHAGDVPLPRIIAAMTSGPATILGLPQGRLAVGPPADLVRFDPDEPYVLDPALLHSRCRNTPFDEARMQGRVKLTLVAGRTVHAYPAT